jgi:hypothetical protein
MPRNDAMWRQWRHTAFIGGLGLSALAVTILLLSAYFAGTAPRLPNNVTVLETLRTSGDWAPVSTRLLNTSGTWSNTGAPAGGVMHEPDNLSRTQVDISDLSPPDHPFHPTED